ncbi:MAG: hypothetical protein AMXMBFR84_11230 [Candidatus Hydrogenedentota bacterium]
MRQLGLAILIASTAYAQAGQFADYAYQAPVAAKSLDTLSALPLETVQNYLTQVDQVHAFAPYLGKNEALKSFETDRKVLRVGAGFAADMSGIPLFGSSFQDQEYTVFLAAIVSADATALRLIVDLSQLAEGEEIYVVDTVGGRAFGPYTQEDSIPEGNWLPTTEGDTALLVARTPGNTPPAIELQGVSHFFRSAAELKAALSCNIDVNCESNSTVQNLSTGVGVMVIPSGNFDSALCSGALINNPDTAENEPYYLTSWHCVPSYANANQVDILWDFRTSSCNANDPPSFSSLPRSNGVSVLGTSSTLDLTLMRLDQVPGGPLGRAYLGWETRAPVVNENLVGIHFPRGEYMRISYGQVKAINQASSGFVKQTYVDWNNGVTEGGSSGSPLLLVASAYRITGTLSNGPTHSCTDTRFNEDYYTSFRDFYPTIQNYVKGTNPGPGPGTDTGICPAEKAFKDYPGAIEALRSFRDQTLQPTAMGQGIVSAYYLAAPFLADVVETSPLAASAFRKASSPFVYLGERNREFTVSRTPIVAPVSR